ILQPRPLEVLHGQGSIIGVGVNQQRGDWIAEDVRPAVTLPEGEELMRRGHTHSRRCEDNLLTFQTSRQLYSNGTIDGHFYTQLARHYLERRARSLRAVLQARPLEVLDLDNLPVRAYFSEARADGVAEDRHAPIGVPVAVKLLAYLMLRPVLGARSFEGGA